MTAAPEDKPLILPVIFVTLEIVSPPIANVTGDVFAASVIVSFSTVSAVSSW